MKKLTFIIFISLFLNNNAYSQIDCSQIKKFSKEYMGCLAKKTKNATITKKIKDGASKLKKATIPDISKHKDKKYIKDWFKKEKK
tara:strand:- start:845 stop:1099 length:255 start_codon:yes stop_codon:yes gene_type:complete